MTTRVSSFSYTQRAIHFSATHNANLLKFQEQISSGLRFQRPSEEPIAFRQVTSLKTRYTELSADRTSIDHTESLLNASVSQIQDFSDVITHAKNLTQQGIQSLDDDERTALALEVDGLLNSLKSIGLAQFNDRYLYGGTQSKDPPFVFTDPSNVNDGLGVTYNGSKQRSRASVGDSIAIDTYYSGLDVFGSRGRGETVMIGQTGAQPGAGTDTLRGRAKLQVTHDTTTFAGASGIQAGASSASSDTIIGAAGKHTLTIVDTAGDGSAGTISLNGRDPVAFTNADTNLEIKGSNGETIFVDASNIAAGFSGTVDIESTGRLSVDGGVTEIPIDFSSSQVVQDSVSGNAVTIDSTNIALAGDEQLEFTGTSDAFQVLFDLSADLRNSRGLDGKQVADSLSRRLGDLETIGKNAFSMMGEQATSLRTIETLGNRVDDLMLSVETQISEVQATDIPDSVLRMENSQNLLQYTYAVTGRLTSLNLLDFLR
ncbi:flagellar hook-associated protein FlgL [Planctomycetes bacterium K23_9]|uniref:Flagellar hook-associated protein 3 n=1 Tax=Stieleria marina TaxID=1930275 RepID=A0A517NSZ3_9BACT|nr:Flagellar hook-associated protein 3 [Planctomycetes bacterium K23_9]